VRRTRTVTSSPNRTLTSTAASPAQR
jgi:hypothetical protein